MEITDQIRQASLDQLRSWWQGGIDVFRDEEAFALDEIAHALIQKGPAGVAVLRRFLFTEDELRRSVSLSSLAHPQLADQRVREALKDAFAASSPKLKLTALWGFIRLAYYPLDRLIVKPLIDHPDQRLSAVSMVYLSRAFPAETIEILRSGLRSLNPRQREYACDEIGDREIFELKEEMAVLMDDPDEAVRQAATINLELW